MGKLFFLARDVWGIDDALTVHIAYLTREYGEDFAKKIPPSERELFSDLFESREGKKYMEFTQSKKQHPRYSWLIDYKYPEKAKHLNIRDNDNGPNSIRPGLLLTNLLHKINRERLQRKFKEAIQAAPPFVYAMLGVSYCYSSVIYDFSWENFIPGHLRERKGEPSRIS